jgi:2'-5' RNA ligase
MPAAGRMRLFVGLAPPAPVLDHLDAACAPLRPGGAGLRWTSQEGRHVTLAFLGDVGEDRLAGLTPRLERAARRHPVLRLSLSGGGAFPSPARATVLWTGLSGDRKGLAELAMSVSAGARRAGAPPPDGGRRYRPHVTLARCRTPANLQALVAALSGYAGPDWAVREMHLIRSQLGPGSPHYAIIGTWKLRPAATTGLSSRGSGRRPGGCRALPG